MIYKDSCCSFERPESHRYEEGETWTWDHVLKQNGDNIQYRIRDLLFNANIDY